MRKHIIGFVTQRSNHVDYIASCNCGTIRLLGDVHWSDVYRMNLVCEGCGNKTFVKLVSNKRIIHPYIELLQKSSKGFKVKRTNLSVFYDDDYNVCTKENMIKVMIYDLARGRVSLYKNGETNEVGRYNLENAIKNFMASVDDYEFKDMISTPETNALYEFTWNSLSNKSYYGERKLWRGLASLISGHMHIQILANAGFTKLSRFVEGYSSTINKAGKNPKEILGIPKFALQYVREDDSIGAYDIYEMQKAFKKVDANKFKELMEIVKDEGNITQLFRALDTIMEIHDNYNYSNLKKLTLYLFREIRMNQGIESPSSGATLLRDYIKMSTELNQEYEKYPKSLKKEHDTTMLNYKVQQNESKKREFVEAVNDDNYKQLEYKKKELSVISPKEMKDLIREGSELSHCVASYVSAIVNKQCQIMFLRRTEDVDTPLATIEVRGDNVRQARGYDNRNLNNKEKEFVKEWADKKKLRLNYYY